MEGHLNLPKRIHSEPLIVHWGVWDVKPIEPKRPRIEFSDVYFSNASKEKHRKMMLEYLHQFTKKDHERGII
jgi:hypothetical protein